MLAVVGRLCAVVLLAATVVACTEPPPPPRPPPKTPVVEPVVKPEPSVRPAWSNDGCRRSVLQERFTPSRRGETVREDFDGDGKADSLRVSVSSGSGQTGSTLQLKLGNGTRFTAETVLPFGRMLHRFEMPKDAPAKVRAVMEDALFGTTCPTPDPSMALLLTDEVVWHEGPAVMPPFYAVPYDSEWRVYAGHTHAGLTGKVSYPIELTKRDNLRILATAHGVFAQSEARHAWLYVSPGHIKLRWPSRFSARFLDDHRVEITRHPSSMRELDEPIVIVRTID